MSIGLQVASESSLEGMLSVCLSVCTKLLLKKNRVIDQNANAASWSDLVCNVLIKSNITRKRFEAGYSNLEH